MGKRKNRHYPPRKVVDFAVARISVNGTAGTVAYKLDCGHVQTDVAHFENDEPVRRPRRMPCKACNWGEDWNKPWPAGAQDP